MQTAPQIHSTPSEVKKYIRTLENVLQSYDLSDKDFLELSRLCGCLDAALEPLVLDEGDE